MTRSMTAFARIERHGPAGRIEVELRTVNHRYLDLSVRLPEALRPLEGAVREQLAARLDRGKVDLTLRLEAPAADGGPEIDERALGELAAAVDRVRAAFGEGPVDPLEVLRWPGVLREPSRDAGTLRDETAAALGAALDELVAARQREGARLAEIVEARLAAIEAIVAEVAAGADGLAARLRTRLAERARALAGDLDPGRLEQEVALLAQKADVAEELDRLVTHVAEMRRTLARDAAAGRRLDFLAQELNREANTLASKASQAGTALNAVDLKVLVEQIREQIQNIE